MSKKSKKRLNVLLLTNFIHKLISKKYFTCFCNNSVLCVVSEACKKIFSGTPLIRNIDDVFLTRGKKGPFVIKST